MSEEINEYVKEFEQLLDAVHASKTIEAIGMNNEQKVMLYTVFLKDRRDKAMPRSGGYSGGSFPMKPKPNPINLEGKDVNSYDYVIDYLTDVGFTKEVKTNNDGTQWELWKARSDLDENISASLSKKGEWYFKFYNRELKSYEFCNIHYSEQMANLMRIVKVIEGREANLKVSGAPPKVSGEEVKLEDMEG